MDIATSSVTVRRDTKTATFTVDALRALATTAMKNAVDPAGAASFADQDATVNADGSITVSVAIETVQADPAPTGAAPVAPATPALQAVLPPSMPQVVSPII